MGDLVLSGKSQQISLKKMWEKGSWKFKNKLDLTFTSGLQKMFYVNDNSESVDSHSFNRIYDSQLLEKVKSIIPNHTNKRKTQININNKIIKVNLKSFGEGRLIKNFKQVIQLGDNQ